MNEDKILRSIILYTSEITEIALTSRPDADRGSVETTSAVMLLIASIYFINFYSAGPKAIAVIDSLVDRLPRTMEDRKVNIAHAVVENELLPIVTAELLGAHHTNLLGAFGSIYNARVKHDLERIMSMESNPGGGLNATALVIGEAITKPGQTPDIMAIWTVLAKHLSNMELINKTKDSANSVRSFKRAFLFVTGAIFVGYIYMLLEPMKQPNENTPVTATVNSVEPFKQSNQSTLSNINVSSKQGSSVDPDLTPKKIESLLIGGEITEGYVSGQKVHMVGDESSRKPYVGFILNIKKRTEDGLVLNGEFKAAAAHYKYLESQGDLSAAHNLGIMYLRGFGVEKDVNLALRYLEKSMSSNANYATSKNYYDKATKENYGTKP